MTPVELPFAPETARVRTAQAVWSRLSVRERLQPVRRFRHRLVSHADVLTAAIQADIGRLPDEVIATDFLPTASGCRFLLDGAEAILKPRRIRSRPLWLIGCRDTVHHRPRGIVGIIGTWNYPLYLNAVPILQALVAGNGVLWKPSEQTPRFAAVLGEFLRDSGFPADIVLSLPATREAGPQLAEVEIDYLHFTGSEAVGRKLASRLGERLIPSALELSGCDALLVLEDANVELAARTAWCGVIMNAGQTCMATRRVFVHRSRLDEFLKHWKDLIAKSKPVRLVLPSQVTHHEKLIAEARGKGATILQNEHPAIPDQCVRPTAIVSETVNLLACQEISFCPIVTVIPFDEISQAVAMHAQCRFGLSGAIFSGNRTRAEELAAQLKVGSVVINDSIAPTAHPATPFGGRGASGWSVTKGREGLLEMTVPQVVTYRVGTFRPHIDAVLSGDPAAGDIMRGMLRFTHGRGWLERCRGLRQMIGGMRRFQS